MIKNSIRVIRRLVGKERPYDEFLREFSFPSDVKERYSDVDITQWQASDLKILMNHCGSLLRERRVRGFRVQYYWDEFLRRRIKQFGVIKYKKHTVLRFDFDFLASMGNASSMRIKEIDKDFVPYLLYMSEFYMQYLEMKDFYEDSLKVINKIDAIEDLKKTKDKLNRHKGELMVENMRFSDRQ